VTGVQTCALPIFVSLEDGFDFIEEARLDDASTPVGDHDPGILGYLLGDFPDLVFAEMDTGGIMETEVEHGLPPSKNDGSMNAG
jgi:hypothetical protein